MLLAPLAFVALVAAGSYVASHEGGSAAPSGEAWLTSNDLISFPDRIVGDVPIPVRIVRHGDQMRIALTDGTQELDAVDVAPNADAIVLPHPPVAAVHRFIVRTTISSGDGRQSVARSVYVLPAGR